MKVSQMKIKVPPDEGVLVLGGRNLYNIAKILEYSCVDIQGFAVSVFTVTMPPSAV